MKGLLWRSITAWFIPAVFCAAHADPKACLLYVAGNGNDSWTGTLPAPNATKTDGPFASLHRARDELRSLRKSNQGKDSPMTVYLRGGRYRLTDTLTLSEEDSGSEQAPVIWQAMPGEVVRLVGGERLRGFARVTDVAVRERLSPEARQHVLQVDLRACGVSDFGVVEPGPRRAELFFNNEYLSLARYPNEGWERIAGIPEGAATSHPVTDPNRPDLNRYQGPWFYSGNAPQRWSKATDVWVHGYWFHDWSDQYHKVERFDLGRKEVWIKTPYHAYGYRKGQRYYYLNILEELDSLGEWYLDRQAGIIYLWPPSPVEQADVMFPVLEKPMLVMTNTRHVHWRGIIFEASRGGGIVIKGGSNNTIAGCIIRNVGGTGIEIDGGTSHTIRSCDVYQVAATAIRLNGGDRKTLTPAGHLVDNCDLHHFGQVFKTYRPAVSLEGVGNRISHCYIHDCPHQGIGYGGNDHMIEYCEFTRVATETGDVGATYTAMDWTCMGHEFRYNYFHNIHGPGQLGCFTIYPDLPCGGINLHHNIFLDVDQVFLTNSGRGMVIENNLFLRARRGLQFNVWMDMKKFQEGGNWRMVERLREVNYDQPPYSTRYPVLARLAEDFAKGDDQVLQRALPKDNLVRRNVSWGEGFFLNVGPQATLDHVRVENNLIADPVVFVGSPRGDGKWMTYRNGDATLPQEVTQRGNVVIAGDPGFGDLLSQDFRLRTDSPAWRLGFEPIPFEKIGLYVDEFRRAIPPTAYEPYIFPASQTFVGSLRVHLTPTPKPGGVKCTLRYTLDGTEPTSKSPAYRQPLRITNTTTVKVAAFVRSTNTYVRSRIVSASYKLTSLSRGGVYLSDLQEQDLLVYATCWKKDSNYLDAPIKLGDIEYDKGLLLHPAETAEGKGRGSVVYNLEGELCKAKRFRAVIGIDDSMQAYNMGSATFIVETLRGGQWERVFESKVLRLADKPVEINVDIAGAERLRLITTDAGDGIACDHATWAMARVE